MANAAWPEHLVEELKKLVAEGTFSQSQMAHKIGVTRNALIGKMHRLGLNRGSNTLSRSEAVTRGLKHHAIRTKLNGHKHRPRIRLIEEEAAPPMDDTTLALPPHEFDLCIPQEQRRQLLELNNFTCRWAIGEVGTKDFFFCGALADLNDGKPYCRHHTRRACR